MLSAQDAAWSRAGERAIRHLRLANDRSTARDGCSARSIRKQLSRPCSPGMGRNTEPRVVGGTVWAGRSTKLMASRKHALMRVPHARHVVPSTSALDGLFGRPPNAIGKPDAGGVAGRDAIGVALAACAANLRAKRCLRDAVHPSLTPAIHAQQP